MLAVSGGVSRRFAGRWAAVSCRSLPRSFSSAVAPLGVWKGPGTSFRIHAPAGNAVLIYREILPSGSTVSCALEAVDGWHRGSFGPNWEVRFKLDGEEVVKQVRSGEEWSDEVRALAAEGGDGDMLHFRQARDGHLWDNPTQNHIWTEPEMDAIYEVSIRDPPVHLPVTTVDKGLHHFVKTLLYNGFNRLTGFDYDNPAPGACAWRLLYLESIAGVPGMVSACLRHFRSLRKLRRDHGWIHTLLEEAENERMHLLICLKMFNAGMATRAAIIVAQYIFTTLLIATYVVRPMALHRFVGYLEECAVKTYAQMIKAIRTPGSKLNVAWDPLPAPDIAKVYYQLDDDAMWVDCLRCMLADEATHRDVNHTFADMNVDDTNPFIAKHHKDAFQAWQRKLPIEDANPTAASK